MTLHKDYFDHQGNLESSVDAGPLLVYIYIDQCMNVIWCA